MRGIPETRALLEAAMEEIVAVAQAQSINLSSESIAKTMAFIDGMQEDVRASMQRDILEGRPSELASQNGAVIRLGRLAHVPTPVNEFLFASLLPQELRARGEVRF
jgi:2-dehydropantoate 2-reductase